MYQGDTRSVMTKMPAENTSQVIQHWHQEFWLFSAHGICYGSGDGVTWITLTSFWNFLCCAIVLAHQFSGQCGRPHSHLDSLLWCCLLSLCSIETGTVGPNLNLQANHVWWASSIDWCWELRACLIDSSDHWHDLEQSIVVYILSGQVVCCCLQSEEISRWQGINLCWSSQQRVTGSFHQQCASAGSWFTPMNTAISQRFHSRLHLSNRLLLSHQAPDRHRGLSAPPLLSPMQQ